MENPFIHKASLAASATTRTSSIPLTNCRTVSITGRCTYGGGAGTATRVSVYYSPDGSKWDTVSYTYFDITLSAGNTVQRTVIIDMPEHGYIKLGVANLDAGAAVTELDVWYSIQSWPNGHVMYRGAEVKPDITQLR